MESTDSFIKEENRGFDEESCGDLDHRLLLQVGAGDDNRDEMKAASPDHHHIKNFMDHEGPTGAKIPTSECASRSSTKTKQLDDQLIGSSKAELDEVVEENQRLKSYLDRILKDYRTLQMQYQEETKKPLTSTQEDPDELFTLSLGRSSSPSDRKDERNTHATNRSEHHVDREGLALGLDCKFRAANSQQSTAEAFPIRSSPENSVEAEAKTEKESGEIDEITQQNPVKRARVSVRVRCDTPTMNDGCQWRKYGQKISKGNPCPRAYYRCTVAPSCPVRKQVQRCAEDMSILITTYEGTHNHPLPISATAMASTTSAAASMLISGSSSSTSGPENLNGLNFYLSDHNNSKSRPFYLPNSSISSNPSFPTITLDLTSNSGSTMPSHLSRQVSIPPKQYSSTNLNFSSLESNPLPISWSNGILNYGALNANQTTNSLSFGASQPYDQTLHQSYMQRSMAANPSQQSVNPDTIAAATKAITSDPSFQSALAAALSSIIGGSSGGANASAFLPNMNEGERNNTKSSEVATFPILSSFPSSSTNTNKCVASYMNNSSSSTSSSQAGMMFVSPPFSNAKRHKSNSPGDHNKDHAA